MSKKIKAPQFPESVADGSIATWYKQPGEAVKRDELIVDIETDKVVLEVVAPANGSLESIVKAEGDTVLSEEVIATFVEGDVASTEVVEEAAPVTEATSDQEPVLSPAARKLCDENAIDPETVKGTGKGGRITKEDVISAIANKQQVVETPVTTEATTESAALINEAASGNRVERRVPMTRMRARIAERLLEASQGTAMLTTFNEVNMQPVMDLRSKYKELFEKTHNGTRLGFMSFFVRAATEALKAFPGG